MSLHHVLQQFPYNQVLWYQPFQKPISPVVEVFLDDTTIFNCNYYIYNITPLAYVETVIHQFLLSLLVPQV